MTVLHPNDARDVEDMVAWAADQKRPLEIRGGASKQGIGLSNRPGDVLDLSRLVGVIDYAPDELVITAHAATPLARVESLLAEEGQMLAFDPPDWRTLLNAGGAPTIAGTVACNVSGSRRVRAGAVRDHLLGFKAVNGRGETWKAGGRVVKNVTGYDLCKLQCGAMGSLSVLTEVTLRTVPYPETTKTVVLFGLSDEDAISAMMSALNAPLDVVAAAHLPEDAAHRSMLAGRGPVTVLRFEGHAPSVAYRAEALRDLLGAEAIIDGSIAARIWSDIGSVRPLVSAIGTDPVWRLHPTPSRAAECVAKLRWLKPEAEAFFDWGGGLIWLSLPAKDAGIDGGAHIIRETVALVGGHATLIAAAPDLRDAAPAFQPEPPAVAALSARIKLGFDPLGVLNPGRLHEDR